MSVNSSSSTNDTVIHQFSFIDECFEFDVTNDIFIASNIINFVAVLPLSICVLVLGFQRWKQQRSSSAVMSPSDFYTYNLAVMELIGGFAVCGDFIPDFKLVGIIILTFPWHGTMFFPVMICVERYMAVVHPITYLRLRRRDWTKYISTVCIWLYCFIGVVFVTLTINSPEYSIIPNAFQMIICVSTITFCSFSILYVLIRPRPGETSGSRANVDRSKSRAFQTVLIIAGVLLLRFGGNLVCSVVISPTSSYEDHCLLKIAALWFNLPSSLVLPLLFLHRAGKLPGCKHDSESK